MQVTFYAILLWLSLRFDYTKAGEEPTHWSIPISSLESPSGSLSPSTPAEGSNPFIGKCGQATEDIEGGNSTFPGDFSSVLDGYGSKNSFPWIVSLRDRVSNVHICGGALVRFDQDTSGSDVVITSARCLKRNAPNTPAAVWYLFPEAKAYWSFAQFVVIAGGYDQRRHNWSIKVAATVFAAHGEFDHLNKTGDLFHDVAVVLLSSPVTFSNTIQPICLPGKEDDVPDGSQGIVAGWERLSDGRGMRQAVLTKLKSSRCEEEYAAFDSDTMLCVEPRTPGMCPGDQGDALIFHGPNGYTMHGVGIIGKHCDTTSPVMFYTRVSAYIDWIDKAARHLRKLVPRRSY